MRVRSQKDGLRYYEQRSFIGVYTLTMPASNLPRVKVTTELSAGSTIGIDVSYTAPSCSSESWLLWRAFLHVL